MLFSSMLAWEGPTAKRQSFIDIDNRLESQLHAAETLLNQLGVDSTGVQQGRCVDSTAVLNQHACNTPTLVRRLSRSLLVC
jgi:hypothetical protein